MRDARARQYVDRERSDLVATVAHELRSPLTGVKGFTSTLLANWDRFTDSQRLLMLRTVDADADRLTRLIVELLDVARIDSGRLTIRKEPVDVAEAVPRQVETLSATNGRAISVQSGTHPRIWVDKDKLAQIVANLSRTRSSTATATSGSALTARPRGGAQLIVDDAGNGIDEADPVPGLHEVLEARPRRWLRPRSVHRRRARRGPRRRGPHRVVTGGWREDAVLLPEGRPDSLG